MVMHRLGFTQAEIRDRPRFSIAAAWGKRGLSLISFLGFTLIELLVVLAVVATLLTLALPRYFGSIDKSKEAVLKENLYQMRDAISRYHADKGKYPETLESLAADKYLRKVPLDPITESAATWVVVAPDDPQKSGVYDVRSGAPGKGIDGTEYAEW
jgi:general secretion pathway protein G